MKKKTLTDDDLESLGNNVAAQRHHAVAAWKKAMAVLPINSREYQAICAAGKKVERANFLLSELAQNREWDDDRIGRVFDLGTSHGFN